MLLCLPAGLYVCLLRRDCVSPGRQVRARWRRGGGRLSHATIPLSSLGLRSSGSSNLLGLLSLTFQTTLTPDCLVLLPNHAPQGVDLGVGTRIHVLWVLKGAPNVLLHSGHSNRLTCKQKIPYEQHWPGGGPAPCWFAWAASPVLRSSALLHSPRPAGALTSERNRYRSASHLSVSPFICLKTYLLSLHSLSPAHVLT